MSVQGMLLYAFVFLAAGVVAVPVARRLGLGSVLGYLVAGALIGPHVLRLVTDAEGIVHVAEFGVVMLLFLIGLELNPKRLWEMRASIFGLGALQVALTVALVVAALGVAGSPWRVGLVAGFGFAMSSTAIVLQILAEKGLTGTPPGKSAFSVLLFQDLAVIPMLALLPLLADGEGSGPGARGAGSHGAARGGGQGINAVGALGDLMATSPLAKVVLGVLVVAGIVIASRTLVRPAFRLVAATRMRELFTALSLLIVVGIALLMDMVGLSMALGTFLAGVVLADSEYRHELEATLEPFKGLLLGVFFTAVGSSMDFSLRADKPGPIVGSVASLLGVKILVLMLCARVARMDRNESTLFSVLLSQGGEFAFVLFTAAQGLGALPPARASELTLVVALSMATTPFLLAARDRLLGRGRVAGASRAPDDAIDEHNAVIVAGLGRVGQIVSRFLHAHKIPTTVIDVSPSLVERTRRFGFKAYYGDATQIPLLESAGLARAKLLVLAFDDRAALVATAEKVRKQYPEVRIVARAYDLIHAYELLDAGVTDLERETFDAALAMGERALTALGRDPHSAFRAARVFKRYDLSLLERLYAIRTMNQDYVSASTASRAEITRLFEEDEAAMAERRDVGWDGGSTREASDGARGDGVAMTSPSSRPP